MLVTLDTDLLTIIDINDLAAPEILAELDHDRFSGVLAIVDDAAVVTSRLTLGATSSTAATIRLADCSPCPADISGDGLLDLTDLTDFLAAFIGGDLAADLAAEFGVLDLGDIIAFVQLFVAGCDI